LSFEIGRNKYLFLVCYQFATKVWRLWWVKGLVDKFTPQPERSEFDTAAGNKAFYQSRYAIAHFSLQIVFEPLVLAVPLGLKVLMTVPEGGCRVF
jgi:hypothetical protein